MDNERYFADLVNGKLVEAKGDAETLAEAAEAQDAVAKTGNTNADGDEGSEVNDEIIEAHSGEGNFEIELARASTSAVASRRTASSSRASKELKNDEAESRWDENEPEGQLTVDVYQTPDDIVVESAIAGVKPDDLDVVVTNDSISIRGARRHEKEVHDSDYLYQECYWGRFARSIILPQEVDPEKADVVFKNGILTVRLPKADKKRSKKLKVRMD
jgi:HSP20 family protein